MRRVQTCERDVIGQRVEQPQCCGHRVAQRFVERQDRAGDLGANRPQVIAPVDQKVSAQQVGERQEGGRLAVGHGTGLDDSPALSVMRVRELEVKARLADPGFPDHGDDLAASALRLLGSAAELLDLGVTSDEASQAACAPRLQPSSRVGGAEQLEGLDRFCDAPDRDRAERLHVDVSLRQRECRRTEARRAWRRELLHARRQVCRLADRGVFHSQVAAYRAHDDLAGVQADTHLHFDAVGATGLVGTAPDRLLQP